MDQRTESSGRPFDREYGTNQSLLAFWDLSAEPEDNSDRDKKLGNEVQATGIAVKLFDDEDMSTRPITGLTEPKEVTSYYVLEPDNWVVRPHTEKGFPDIDNTWDVRLVADHTNKNYEREHRSTQIINQCDTQHWGWLSDLTTVALLRGVENEHEELFLDAAGFWFKYTENDAIKDRGQAAWNAAQNAGFITDGQKDGFVAQLWHLLHLTPPCVEQAEGVCEPVLKTELVLPGNHAWQFGEDLATISHCSEGAEEQEGVTQVGQFIVRDELNELPPSNDHNADDSSNNPVLDRCPHKGLWVCIKIPFNDYYGYAVPPKDQFG